MHSDDVQPGLEVWVNLGKERLAGKVLETAYSHKGDYLQCRVEITQPNPLDPDKPLVSVYPTPIQSYKLTFRGKRPTKPRRNYRQEMADNTAKLQEVMNQIDRKYKIFE